MMCIKYCACHCHLFSCYTLCGWILRRCGVFYDFKCACCDTDRDVAVSYTHLTLPTMAVV